MLYYGGGVWYNGPAAEDIRDFLGLLSYRDWWETGDARCFVGGKYGGGARAAV